MKELNLKIEECIVTGLIYTETGRIYKFRSITTDEEKEIITRYYDTTSEFMSRELGSELSYAKDKTIYLISDKERILALKNSGSNVVIIKDYITRFQTELYGNTDYIKSTYGLTEEEFLKILRENSQSKKLKLK